MFLKRFLKPKVYNSYRTRAPGNIYHIDLFSLSGLLGYIGFEMEEETIHKPKGPWVLSCIDMHSRYLEAQYVGPSVKMEYVINAFILILMKMGLPLAVQADDQFNKQPFRNFCDAHGIRYFFWKPYENPKNQLIERSNRTIKQFMMKYVNKWGWPSSENFADDVQQVLDACTWYYNRIWHTGINAIPFEVFRGYDDNRQKNTFKHYDRIPLGTIVLRKPYRKLSNVPLTVYQVDPEPFIVVDYDGGQHVGKYQLKSLVTNDLESRWYKPYELRIIPRSEYEILFKSPVLQQYIKSMYGDDVLNAFYETIHQMFGVNI
jgi:hypothetical protein